MTIARVQISTVFDCKNAVDEIRNLDQVFMKSQELLLKLKEAIDLEIQKLCESNRNLQNALSIVEQRISEVKHEINNCKEEIEELEERLSSLEEQDGENEDDSDASDASDCYFEMSSIQIELNDLENRINDLETKLLLAEKLESEIKDLLYQISSDISSIETIRDTISVFIDEIGRISNDNQRICTNVFNSLINIHTLVEQYLQKRIKLNDLSINDSMQSDSNPALPSRLQQPSQAELHPGKEGAQDIELDEYGRICQYNGRRFGGKYNSYEERLNSTLQSSRSLGKYDGERGESKFIPSIYTAKGLTVINILNTYGLDGIVYRNAEPDFEVCCEATVKINNMTEDRDNNFSSADRQLVKQWNLEKHENLTNWTQKAVYAYRTKNRLTWHEKCDTETMVLVRREINGFFKHSGGVAECKKRDANRGKEDEFDE